MGTLTAPMASVAKSVIAHSQRFSLIDGDAVAGFGPPSQKRLCQCPDTLVDLVGRYGQPVTKLILPQDCARVGCGSDAAKKVIDGGEGRV